ncbi:hypothetical protein [Rhodanobacter denitrificans]|uniref:Uncharacterized protein n=1 Tax=Rhodanobacter denitrificans TaxID=666685 RepID=M4NGU3_9GAMM|nr:hypothetical protein [Rhodanobacter denitrificans]AGG90114.1 hypothetical protein R2APBS1_3040 [Rhodanobacter denitrificans]UJM85503.1 hypothetical protein LRJ86_12030 [Rhodanobacter denitrificans]
MRGKIIHYNGNDGKGLILAGERQFAFDISQWRSDSAPTVNQTVELGIVDDQLQSVTRITDDVLLKEKAGVLAGRLGSAGGAALQSLKEGAPAGGAGAWLTRLGKPLLIAQGLFAIGALFLSYLEIKLPGTGMSRGFSLTSLAGATESLGGSAGSSFWPWLGILSIGLPLFWRNRWAWLALLLPLLATLKPWFDIHSAISQAGSAGGSLLGSGYAQQMSDQISNMLSPGAGAVLCLLTALFIAAIGLKRALLSPAG